MKIVLIISGFIFCFISCNNHNDRDNFKRQKELRQYIESREDMELSESFVPKNEFVFLEVIERQSAKIISSKSKYLGVPGRLIDFPTYNYYDSMKVLKTRDRHFNFDKEKLKLIIGKGLILGDFRGGGAATGLYDINYLPYFNGETGIYEIDSTGAVYMRHKNIYYKIDIGKTIIDSSFFMLTIEGPDGGVVRVKKEFHISNHGLLNKNAIIFDTIRNN
jgi:hypothetical protein